jgi:hypothetical protein
VRRRFFDHHGNLTITSTKKKIDKRFCRQVFVLNSKKNKMNRISDKGREWVFVWCVCSEVKWRGEILEFSIRKSEVKLTLRCGSKVKSKRELELFCWN